MKTVFIVDDNDANLFAAQTALTGHYNVYTLPSAIAMFKLIEKVVPDLVLLDIKMPEMDGFEALEKLKADSRFRTIPVIFLTGQTDEGLEEQGIGLGAADFMQKPFSEPLLLHRIKTHMEIARMKKQLGEV